MSSSPPFNLVVSREEELIHAGVERKDHRDVKHAGLIHERRTRGASEHRLDTDTKPHVTASSASTAFSRCRILCAGGTCSDDENQCCKS
jgi:hypothetical protein